MLSRLFGKKRKQEQNTPFLGVAINKNAPTWPDFFGVSPERNRIIEEAMRNTLRKHAGNDEIINIRESEMVYDFLTISNDPGELMYCIFQAGRKNQEVFELMEKERDPKTMIMKILMERAFGKKEMSH